MLATFHSTVRTTLSLGVLAIATAACSGGDMRSGQATTAPGSTTDDHDPGGGERHHPHRRVRLDHRRGGHVRHLDGQRRATRRRREERRRRDQGHRRRADGKEDRGQALRRPGQDPGSRDRGHAVDHAGQRGRHHRRGRQLAQSRRRPGRPAVRRPDDLAVLHERSRDRDRRHDLPRLLRRLVPGLRRREVRPRQPQAVEGGAPLRPGSGRTRRG